MNSKLEEIIPLIEEIRLKFPEVALEMDQWLIRQGFDEESKAYFAMIEAFSNATTAAIKRKDKDTVLKYLLFMEEKLKSANETESKYIDVYYVESLMWDINDPELYQWGWSLIPEKLKKLYLEVWDEPRF